MWLYVGYKALVPDPLQVLLGVEVALLLALRIWAEPRAADREGIVELEGGWFAAVMRGFALAQIVTLLLAVAWPPGLSFAAVELGRLPRIMGGAVGAGGLAALLWIHRSLGANYHSVLHLRDAHELITRGPYRRVRHPMYTALFVVFVGFGLLSANLAVAAVCLGGLAVIVARRLPREEAMLLERFGSAYEAYMRRTGRFLP